MDESLQDFEAELKALRPRRPSARLVDRVERDLFGVQAGSGPVRYVTATNLPSWKWSGWRTAGVAAAFAVLATVGTVILRRQPASTAANPPVVASADPAPAMPRTVVSAPIRRYQPVAATNVLYDLKDEGLVTIDDGTPARRVRARYLDTYTWKNPATNASLKWSVPRDEIRVLPARLN